MKFTNYKIKVLKNVVNVFDRRIAFIFQFLIVFSQASMACGLQQRALDESTKYAMTRNTFGKPIIEYQVNFLRLCFVGRGVKELVSHFLMWSSVRIQFSTFAFLIIIDGYWILVWTKNLGGLKNLCF